MLEASEENKMEKFKNLGISEEILKSIAEHKFEKPTEIQEKSIPLVLSGKDVIAGAATGSGKTLAFSSAIINTCENENRVQALVLVPTRELAEQNAKSLRLFSKFKRLNIALVYGGVSINPQIKEASQADIIVGTPGRILDHLERRTLDLSEIKILVLDEADRMLDMGFIDDVEKIIGRCNKQRQTLLFSATLPKEIKHLASKYMKDPVEVFAESQVDPSKLTQIYYDVQDNMKFALLVHLLKQDKSGLVMIFCNTQRNTDFVDRNLKLQGIRSMAIHGGYSQDKRTKALDKFHSKDIDVLVCTDVAARGLDIKGVSHVYNYDAPNESGQYIHRIGRTARAGHEGKAVNIVASRDYENFRKIMRENVNLIKREELPEFSAVQIEFKHKPRFRGGSNNSHGRFQGRRNFSRSRFSGRRGNFHGRRDSRRF